MRYKWLTFIMNIIRRVILSLRNVLFGILRQNRCTKEGRVESFDLCRVRLWQARAALCRHDPSFQSPLENDITISRVESEASETIKFDKFSKRKKASSRVSALVTFGTSRQIY